MRATIAIAAIGVAAALWRAGGPTLPPSPLPLSSPSPAVAAQPAPAAYAAGAAAKPAALRPAAPSGPAAAPAAGPAASAAARIAHVQAAVQAARRQGQDEQEVHRLRMAQLPAQQVEALARMEAAEKIWRQRLDALHAACAAGIGCEDARASFTREELARTAAYAAPALRR